MQTFLPYYSFTKSAQVLDRQRLGKQRVETMQLMSSLLVVGAGWSNHPASRMWRGYEPALMRYQEAVCREWTHWRGYKDTCLEKTRSIYDMYRDASSLEVVEMPPWLGDKKFHRSHKSNLVRKDPGHYRQFFPNVPDDLEYIWPEGR